MGEVWAVTGRLGFAGGVPFRHELASLLLIDGPLRGLVDGAADPDLVRYLVLAHHGKLRVQVRDPAEASSGRAARAGARRCLAGASRCSASPDPS